MKLTTLIATGLAAGALTLAGCEDAPKEVPEPTQEAPVENAAPAAEAAPAGDVAAEAKAEAEKTVTADNAATVLDDLAKEIEADVAE